MSVVVTTLHATAKIHPHLVGWQVWILNISVFLINHTFEWPIRVKNSSSI